MTARLNNAYETLKDPVKRRDFEESFFGIRRLADAGTSLLIPLVQSSKFKSDEREQAAAAKVRRLSLLT